MRERPPWLSDLLTEEVDDRIENDPRSRPGTFLGWPRDRIFQDVLGWGQANFDEPLEQLFDGRLVRLTGEDRALLYAKYNQGRHLDELAHAFGQLLGTDAPQRTTVLDLGCGPFTAGLALAASLGGDRTFRYFGIDRAVAMRALGERFVAAARARAGLSKNSLCQFVEDLDAIDFGAVRGDLMLVVASYLLASPTLDVGQLVASVLRALTRIGPGPVAVLYTNSAAEIANTKYPAFRDALLLGGFEVLADGQEVFAATKNPKPLRYALLFRKECTTITSSPRV